MTYYLKEFSKYFIVPICIFILFRKAIEKILITFIVDPIFSSLSQPSPVYDVTIGVLFFVLTIPILYKVFQGAKIPFKWLCVSLTYLSIYWYYRISANPFQFTPLSFSKHVVLFDIINSVPLISILEYVCMIILNKPSTKGRYIIQDDRGFAVDEAKVIDGTSDLLNRIKFIKEIATKIKNTKTEMGSFPIGVVANWGSGKSTFINTLAGEFPKNEFIIIELNVWKCNNTSLVIETLFKLLKTNLKNYSFTIDNKLQDYSTNLLKGAKSEGLNSLKNISELFLPDTSMEKQYDSINSEIKQIGRKIVILIDDLDRLDKKELYEVIRLIRNTANFVNTFFVVAYDRNYILNAIEEINPYQSHYFLEKIFQVEFTLPPIDDKVIQEEITKRIETFLTETGKKEYQKLITRGLTFFDYGYADLTTLFIFNIRDVVRFINSFKLSYEFVKDEIHLPDFYNLELVRFKHPELFSKIYKNRYNFFTTNKDDIHKPATLDNLYCLTKAVKDGKPTQIPNLLEYINSEKNIYKLSSKEINTICDAFSSIFPDMGATFSSKKDSVNYRLTVLKPSMFDRYFILDIGGNLSEIEFSRIRVLPVIEFTQKLSELSLNEDKVFD
ncbi:MAG TPA: P-loop NTPase fold protein, partial [Ferruginibacter sp.]|nr:P-loop NTPase fold protein [Ferruginibacter sp.]